MEMTDKTTNMLVDTLNDLEEPFSPVMELTAKSVTGCLTNVLQSAAGAGQANSNSLGNQSSSKVELHNPTFSQAESGAPDCSN